MNNETVSQPKGGTLRRVHLMIRSNWISSFGAVLMTMAMIAFVTGLALQQTGNWGGPYMDILTIVIIPILFVFGLLLVPFGLVLYRKHLRERIERIADRPLYLARAVVVITFVNFTGLATVGYTGVQYMSSVEFCGTACHSIMEPEYVASLDSPHSHVSCVECHVGAGAEAFIASKLNGTRQLIHTLLDDYSRPIPTPVHGMRTARETCETCHWPEKYLGTKLLVRSRFREDEAVSPYINVLLMRTGGTRPDGKSVGIHWHVHPDAVVEYVASDDKRMEIPWVRVRMGDGSERLYAVEGVAHDTPPEGDVHQMDCNDCHNRSAHDFHLPEDAIDRAISSGLISRKLPFIKKRALETLRTDWTRDGAADGIRQDLLQAYAASNGLDEEMLQLLDGAIGHITAIWKRNVYPERKLFWNSYPDLSAHVGCFRCHDGEHKDPAGNPITKECSKCHVVLSENEENPAILNALGLQQQR